MKFPLPDKILCLATSTRGTYCVGGTESGRIHVWEVTGGMTITRKRTPQHWIMQDHLKQSC